MSTTIEHLWFCQRRKPHTYKHPHDTKTKKQTKNNPQWGYFYRRLVEDPFHRQRHQDTEILNGLSVIISGSVSLYPQEAWFILPAPATHASCNADFSIFFWAGQGKRLS